MSLLRFLIITSSLKFSAQSGTSTNLTSNCLSNNNLSRNYINWLWLNSIFNSYLILTKDYFFCKELNCSAEQWPIASSDDRPFVCDIKFGDEHLFDDCFLDFDIISLFQLYTQNLNTSSSYFFSSCKFSLFMTKIVLVLCKIVKLLYFCLEGSY